MTPEEEEKFEEIVLLTYIIQLSSGGKYQCVPNKGFNHGDTFRPLPTSGHWPDSINASCQTFCSLELTIIKF